MFRLFSCIIWIFIAILSTHCSQQADPRPDNRGYSSPSEMEHEQKNHDVMTTSSRVNQTFRPGALWYDRAGHVINAHGAGFYFENGLYYWFGEDKAQDAEAHTGFHVYSSSDLYNWQDEGIAFAIAAQPKGSEIQEGCIMERPKVVFNAATQKYVMWFHLELKGQGYGAARAAVAISSTVTGPYIYQGSFRPNNAMSRDQTIFVDDDGKAYQFAASEDNQTTHVSELTSDYLRPTGKFQRIFEGRGMEAPAVFKYQGHYYFIGSACTGWDPNAARSAVASNIMGPWTELGNPARGVNADKTFNGQSTYVLPIAGEPSHLIFVADRWNSSNLQDSRYLFLPIHFDQGKFFIPWHDEWDLSVFE